MAAVVSHAMRRFPSTSPDTAYSYGLRGEGSGKRWSGTEESALSRSMRYADPWLYGSVRSPNGLLLTPAFVLCACSDYVNGTKRKKSPTTCKKCKGTRLPFSSKSDCAKFGTVRCYPSSPTVTPPNRGAGTVRVSSSSRPSILPPIDPYDLMRRSRLSVPESGSQFRARSISPHKSRLNESRNLSGSRAKPIDNFASLGRKSILECNINPYDLMSASTELNDSSITLVNGQRIRVRPSNIDYEDVKCNNVKQQPKNRQTSPPPNEKESENNRFKSILKKRPTTFSDTVLSSPEHSPSPSAQKSGSHFYLPMPGNHNTPRKKVQFLVENERVSCETTHSNAEQPNYANVEQEQISEDSVKEKDSSDTDALNQAIPEKRVCKLRRSESERLNHEPNKVVFLDTMALRSRRCRSDSRIIFAEKDLERLDGLSSKNRKLSPTKPRPNQPPPPPPKVQVATGNKISKTSKKSTKVVDKERTKNEVNKLKVSQQETIPVKKEEKSNDKVTINKDIIKIPIDVSNDPPSVPPRKRSNNKPLIIQTSTKQTVKVESPSPTNKTIVQINTSNSIHKLQIKNDFLHNIQSFSIVENPQRKTSILINGDDCYSTVNVNDDVPLYQSSVVVKDAITDTKNKKSSSVYITGNFINPKPTEDEAIKEETTETLIDSFNETNIPSSELLQELLKDPVEAVRRNLVPHVCGKSDMRRSYPESEDLEKLRTYESIDNCSEHSSTQYELMDGSECYTDHSNRSSVTEEELANRTKFYELLADSVVEVTENDDHHYESIKTNQDPIYEEIEVPPPLPANPPPSNLLDDLQLDKEYTTRSIFEGASKYDILSYLVDAKERVQEDSYSFNFHTPSGEETKESYNRVSHMSTVSDSSEENSLIMSNNLIDDKTFQKAAEVERNDSGVGSETSKSSLSKYRTKQETSVTCEDCETIIDCPIETEPLICRKCIKKRSERKEIIMEIVETEEKYSRDLQIILEEFYQPMLVAGLLTPDQLAAIFLNAEELLENSQSLAERLRDAVEIALEQGDEDLLTVNIGKILLEAAPMLHGFETYCIRQGSASLLLASLEKDKELLRIFLRVSQMENTMLRRMNLNSFLMVPVQRVTKYPLLLARLYKVTPAHHETKEQLKEAQHKIELHLNHMNSETKDVPSKLWRRIGSSGRRSSTEMDLVNIKLRKIAVDVLEWNHDEAKFALEGKLLFTQPTDNNWRKGRTIKLTPINALLVVNGKLSNNRVDKPDENLIFSRHSLAREAALLLVRDKNGRYSLLREPLYLDRCIIAADPAWQSYFEVQELLGKDTFIFKAEDEEQTRMWYNQLQYHAQGMGAWRKRRNALANIMINGMGLRT